MKSTLAALAAMTICLPFAQAQTGAKPFDMYFVDTEGGLAALYVSPSGETMLLDTGNPGDRDGRGSTPGLAEPHDPGYRRP